MVGAGLRNEPRPVLEGASSDLTCWFNKAALQTDRQLLGAQGFILNPSMSSPAACAWLQTSLSHGATLTVCLAGGFKVPVWGEGGKEVDIAVAYEKAAAAVLAQRPTYLIFAQGLMAGRDLRAVAKRPLVMRTRYPDGPLVFNQLVYEVRAGSCPVGMLCRQAAAALLAC